MLTSLVNLQLILYQGENRPSGYCADKYAHQLGHAVPRTCPCKCTFQS